QPIFQFWLGDGNEILAQYSAARGVAIASLDISPPPLADIFTDTQEDMATGSVHGSSGPLGMVVTSAAAEQLLGVSPGTARPGHTGRTVQGGPAYSELPVAHPARNVVAILPGSDPARRNTYVAIGAHSDHIGTVARPIEHDSLRAFNRVIRPGGAEGAERPANAQEQARIRQTLDSLRLRRPPRADSVFNGADDDGSGSVALLEMAEYFVTHSSRPARSLLFIWHTAEEKGLFGAQYFTEHPTIPRDSIVAQLNIDMIGRGGRWDTDGGGPSYMQLIGARRLSSELGALVETVNTDGGFGFRFDYQYDADGHPQNFYCRSDHYMYARFSIPVVFFSTGSHVDYHMLTDEPQYIDYDKLLTVTRFIAAVATQVAGTPNHPVVDGSRPDPFGVCRQ
ncbi:MAG: M28 family peptidase, partial [Gemmatimonadales bacterium]